MEGQAAASMCIRLTLGALELSMGSAAKGPIKCSMKPPEACLWEVCDASVVRQHEWFEVEFRAFCATIEMNLWKKLPCLHHCHVPSRSRDAI